MPDVVTLEPKFDVPETDRFATAVIASSTSALPVMVKLYPPPLTVDSKLTKPADNTR